MSPSKLVLNNTEMMTLLVQEIQINIQEKISQVNILVQEYEIKSKDVGQMMKEDHRKEMASIEGQLFSFIIPDSSDILSICAGNLENVLIKQKMQKFLLHQLGEALS